MYIVFIYFSAVPNSFKCLKNACFKGIVFKMFSAVPNRFLYRQNACFRDIFFKKISVVLNHLKYVRMHALEAVFSFVSLQFKIVSNAIKMHALHTCTQSTQQRTHCQRREHFKILQSAIKT